VVARVGSRVRRVKVGDEVYSYSWADPKGGFYAEYVAVASNKVAHIPARLDLEHAGAIPTTGLTALQGIDDALELKRGEASSSMAPRAEWERISEWYRARAEEATGHEVHSL
jgi:NADPH:quinone reductase-like Zn-dependent oxidoreductase